jgi:tryptophan synthase alpha chain
MKSIRQTIIDKGHHITNVYFTAGHPTLESVVPLIHALERSGADLIELGMPYSDPLADGTTIQQSSAIALAHGQTITHILDQVRTARASATIPIILMGYYNQMLQYGVERFIADCGSAGIQGLIIPDLPMDIYVERYRDLFERHSIEIAFLITPMTSDERIRQADSLSSAFLYVVSQSSITGKQGSFDDTQLAYFQRIKDMKLISPQLLGFGIHNAETFDTACRYFHGAIIGSAFIRAIDGKVESQLAQTTSDFLSNIISS